MRELTELLKSKRVKTRKDHTCQGCGKKIDKGSCAQSDTLAGDGEIWTFYHCDECWQWWQKKCNKCKDLQDGFCIAEHYPIGAIAECMRECSNA